MNPNALAARSLLCHLWPLVNASVPQLDSGHKTAIRPRIDSTATSIRMLNSHAATLILLYPRVSTIHHSEFLGEKESSPHLQSSFR